MVMGKVSIATRTECYMSPISLVNLVDFITQEHSFGELKLEGVSGGSSSLKTRLLEVGFTQGSIIHVFRNGGHYLIKLRGDTLLLRASEAQHLLVSVPAQ